jgi:hypothetical protein
MKKTGRIIPKAGLPVLLESELKGGTPAYSPIAFAADRL